MRRFLPLTVALGLTSLGCVTTPGAKKSTVPTPPPKNELQLPHAGPVADKVPARVPELPSNQIHFAGYTHWAAKATETSVTPISMDMPAVPAATPATPPPPTASVPQTSLPAQPATSLPATSPGVPPSAPVGTPARVRPAYARLETLPVDLPTVIRLVNENSPAIGIARARVREAQARLDGARAQWLPDLRAGVSYNRLDGQTQNQNGAVFGLSRSNLFAGGGVALSLDLAEAVYRPLIERRLTSSAQRQAQAVNNDAELDSVLAYLDLVQTTALLEINKDTLSKAEAMLSAAKNAREAKLDRVAGDVNRAQTEVLFRQTEQLDIEARIVAASARLGRLLLLQPNIKLVPIDAVIAPLTLVDPGTSLDDLIARALANRPDLEAGREAIAAAWARVRRRQRGPFLPRVTLANQVGTFGGGVNADVSKFSSQNVLNLQLFWELRNFGLGNRAEVNEQRALLDQAQFRLAEGQARALADIVETAQLAAARYEALELAERAVKEASELYRINKEGTFNVVDARNLFDALRPLQSIQVLNQARQSYLSSVIDFNRTQYRLLTLVGVPPASQASIAQPAR